MASATGMTTLKFLGSITVSDQVIDAEIPVILLSYFQVKSEGFRSRHPT